MLGSHGDEDPRTDMYGLRSIDGTSWGGRYRSAIPVSVKGKVRSALSVCRKVYKLQVLGVSFAVFSTPY